MKSRFLKITFAAALAVIAGVTAYQAQNKETLSDLALANVEALAEDENWFESWWNSKIYACQSVQVWVYKCIPYKDIPKEDGDWEINIGGSFDPNELVCGLFKEWDTECVGGSETAHCWDCE